MPEAEQSQIFRNKQSLENAWFQLGFEDFHASPALPGSSYSYCTALIGATPEEIRAIAAGLIEERWGKQA